MIAQTLNKIVSATKVSRNIHTLNTTMHSSQPGLHRNRCAVRMRHMNAKNRLGGYRSRDKRLGQSFARSFTKGFAYREEVFETESRI